MAFFVLPLKIPKHDVTDIWCLVFSSKLLGFGAWGLGLQSVGERCLSGFGFQIQGLGLEWKEQSAAVRVEGLGFRV